MQMPNITDNMTNEQKLAMNVVTLNTAVNELQTDVAKLDKVLITGNGEPSIREVVRKHDEVIKNVQYWSRFVGGALVLQTLAFLSGILVAIIKFLPVLERLAK